MGMFTRPILLQVLLFLLVLHAPTDSELREQISNQEVDLTERPTTKERYVRGQMAGELMLEYKNALTNDDDILEKMYNVLKLSENAPSIIFIMYVDWEFLTFILSMLIVLGEMLCCLAGFAFCLYHVVMNFAIALTAALGHKQVEDERRVIMGVNAALEAHIGQELIEGAIEDIIRQKCADQNSIEVTNALNE